MTIAIRRNPGEKRVFREIWAGNRSAHTIGYSNEIVSDGTNTYTYDKEGNRKTKVDSSGTTTYTWDHHNRLTQVQTTVTVDYKYDLFDRRIERAVASGATQRFGYDGDSIVLETDGADAVTHRYLHGPVIDQVFADERVAGGNLGNHWLLTDHLGTVRDLATDTGSMGLHIPFNSFGVRGTTQGSGPETLYSFTGRERDVETGLYYYRARYYDPAVGTFVSVDPIGFDAGDSNLYRYVTNAPTAYSDPKGLYPNRFGAKNPDWIINHIKSLEAKLAKEKGKAPTLFETLNAFEADQTRNVDAGSNHYYVFTRKHWYMDMRHFAVNALLTGQAGGLKSKQNWLDGTAGAIIAHIGSEGNELLQGLARSLPLSEKWIDNAASAYTPEDRPSNEQGMRFGFYARQEFDKNPKAKLSDVLQKFFKDHLDALPTKDDSNFHRLPASEAVWQDQVKATIERAGPLNLGGLVSPAQLWQQMRPGPKETFGQRLLGTLETGPLMYTNPGLIYKIGKWFFD